MLIGDEEYKALRAKVREVGHLSDLSPRIDFLALRNGDADCDWLDIKWGGGSTVTVRLEIRNSEIRLIGPFIEIERNALNSCTIKRADIKAAAKDCENPNPR